MKNLLDRVSNPALRSAAAACLAAHEELAAKKEAVKRDGKLTESGQRDALRAALPDAIRKLTSAARPIKKAIEDAKSKRDALRFPERAKDDAAGAIADWEVREVLRALSPGDKAALLMGTTDTRILRAVVSGPPETIGLTGNQAQIAVDLEARYLELLHGDALREIEAAAADGAEADAIARVARNGIADTVDMNAHVFEQFAGPLEKGATAPWLIRNENSTVVCEVDDAGAAQYHSASPWQIENGRYFKNADEYRASRGLT